MVMFDPVGGFMARIEGVSESELNDDVRQIFEEQTKRHGFVSNTAKIFALRPTIQKGVQALAQGIQESGLLTPELRNLVCVRTAQINGCRIELIAMHPGRCTMAPLQKKSKQCWEIGRKIRCSPCARSWHSSWPSGRPTRVSESRISFSSV